MKRIRIKANRQKGEIKLAKQVMNVIEFISYRYGAIKYIYVTQMCDDFINDKLSIIFEFEDIKPTIEDLKNACDLFYKNHDLS